MSTPRFLLSLTVGLALVPLLTGSAPACQEPTLEPSLEQRLEKLSRSLEAAREAAHVPGMSIAIVKDGELVWARGFGLADVEAGRPADESTIYAIGSSTKAFTATLVGMLVDEGKAGWDDPVTRFLPYFDLQVRSEDENAECTLRDLLSHRHGFSRMGILWFGNGVTREDLLRTAAGAEPWDDFRESFHYCNVTYLAAGEAAGVADGSSWDEMMVERLFEPLGMESSTTSTAEAKKDPRLALGYEWDEDLERCKRQRMIELANIGPAGSVNSNVVDMARWLQVQLGRGEVDGMRLISAERLRDTWTPQIAIGQGASYGLGWMLREHDGRQVVEHGGNIDGFSAQVALCPEEDLGYVLLMNLNASPLQQSSIAHVFDALLDEWPAEIVASEAQAVPEELDLEDYLGVYVANFATFRDEPFEVLIEEDHLALDIPSQRTFELAPPDGEGKWFFTLTDQIAVTFQRDDQGKVSALTIHQSGFSFEVPRQGTELPTEVPAGELEKYTGIFVRAQGGKRVELSIVGGRLTMEDKGKLLAFQTPDAEGHAALRARADFGATFEVDAEGHVPSFVFHGSAGDQLFTRLAETRDTELPTLDEVLALRRTEARVAALEGGTGTRITGKVRFAQAGVEGALTILSRGTDRYANHMDFGRFGRIDLISRGGEAWRYTSMRGFEVLTGDRLAQALLEHPGAVEGDWKDYFDSLEVVRNDTLNDRPAHVVRLEKQGLPSRTYWIDAETGDVVRVKQIMIEGPIRVPITTTLSAFEERNGVRYPMRVESENPESGRMVLTFERVESDLELGDEVFTLVDPEAEEGAKH